MYPPQKHIVLQLQLLLLTLLPITPISFAVSRAKNHDSLFCESWRFSVETNNAGNWSTFPNRCYGFVKNYMTGDRYKSDLNLTARNALEYAKSVNMVGDGMDAWVFDIDETLLSTLPYFETHHFRATDMSNEIRWGLEHYSPVLHSSLSLYKDLQLLGFKIFLLTGRPEWFLNRTISNLLDVGYRDWERLIVRQPSDESKRAIDYKSENRKKLIDEGYRIHGSSGDQWSDLLGFAIAQRSFKYPNLMYYVA